MARRIDHIVVHCSGTSPGWNIGAEEIRALHGSSPNLTVPWDGSTLPGKGWADIGYHWVIRRDGRLEPGRNPKIAGAHAKGYNSHSIGVCLVGGVDAPGGRADANFSIAQYGALEELLRELTWQHKNAEVLGHRDLPDVAKACPSFDVKSWWYR
jgi:hypothetical protein